MPHPTTAHPPLTPLHLTYPSLESPAFVYKKLSKLPQSFATDSLAEVSRILNPKKVNFEVGFFVGYGVTFEGNLVVSPFSQLFHSLVDTRYQ
jgi:hypothetical protein